MTVSFIVQSYSIDPDDAHTYALIEVRDTAAIAVNVNPYGVVDGLQVDCGATTDDAAIKLACMVAATARAALRTSALVGVEFDAGTGDQF